jgi:hypothetical protein
VTIVNILHTSKRNENMECSIATPYKISINKISTRKVIDVTTQVSNLPEMLPRYAIIY